MDDIIITFPGKAFGELRDDQQMRVQQMMLSWHAVGGFWCDMRALRRAIRKVRNNYP